MKNQDKQILTAAAIVAGGLLLRKRAGVSGIGKLPTFTLKQDERDALLEEFGFMTHAVGEENDWARYDRFRGRLTPRELEVANSIEDYLLDENTYAKIKSSQLDKEERELLQRFGDYIWDTELYFRLNNYDLMDAIDKIRG